MREITMRLGRRPDGMWQKRIDGRLHYFGRGSQADALRLLAAFITERNRAESFEPTNAVTVAWVANHFRDARKDKISGTTLKDYDKAVGDFVGLVGRDTLVASLTADDFDNLRRKWEKDYGVYRQRNNIGAIRTMFRWAVDNQMIANTPRYGAAFRGPRKMEFNAARRRRNEERGERRFTHDELAKMLPALRQPVVTWVLLALNGAMYSADVSDLLWDEIKRRDGEWIIDRKRGKTGVDHRFVLWPETVAALGKRGEGRVFLSPRRGPLNNRVGTDRVNIQFVAELERIGVERRDGIGFGSLKHTHISAVNALGNLSEVKLTRGHEFVGIDQHYDFPSIDRLKRVSDLARENLLVKTLGERLRTFADALALSVPSQSHSVDPVLPAGSQQ